MASIRIPDLPQAGPTAEPWPADEFTVRADEMFARRPDTEFAAGVHDLLHNPKTGLSSLSGEAALEAIAGVYPALEELRQSTLDGAVGPRQRDLLAPLVQTRLDWATRTIGRLAERATRQVDDASVAERIVGLQLDAAVSWDDPAHLLKLGRATVEELRWLGERRDWDAAEIEARARTGLSDLYAGAVEAAIGRDPDGAGDLLAHAREAIDPTRLEAVDQRISRAREDRLLREVDTALSTLPLDPAAPPTLDIFSARVAELTPSDATDQVHGRLGELAAHAQRRAERQWNRRQAEAGVASLDWLRQNPGASSLFLPEDVRGWLAPDQLEGLGTLDRHGRLVTDRDLFERLDRELIYAPEVFAGLDLNRFRLSLDDRDHERLASAQKAIAEGKIDPVVARHRQARIGVDRALEGLAIDMEGLEATDIRADMRGWLDDFEAIEGRPATHSDIDAIVVRAVGGMADAAVVQDAAEPFDPRHVIPAQAGRPPIPPRLPATSGQRPAPGPGHNNPPPQGSPPNQRPTDPPQPSSRSSQPQQPPSLPDGAGPAAAAPGGSDEIYRTYREHLAALDPENPLLKLEPVPGVPPDKVTVESVRKEVQGVVQRRVSTFMWPNYPDKSQVRGTRTGAAREVPGGEEQAEKDFAELSKRGTPVDEPYGQNAGFDRRVRLPGTGMTVGIRRNAEGVPTLDINSPETRSQKYHYK